MLRVLVTDAGSKNSLAAVRDLARSGHEVHTLGARLSLANWSNAVSQTHAFQGGVTFGDCVLSLVEKNGIECVIPVGAASTFALNDFRQRLEGVVFFAIGPTNAMRIASSKRDTQVFAEKHGLFVPNSKIFSSYPHFIEAALKFPLPYVVKPDSHLSPHAPLYVMTEAEREQLIQAESVAPMFLYGGVQIQEYIGGHGEGLFALYRDGECIRQMMHMRLEETPKSGGSSWAARSIYEPDLELLGHSLLTAMKWHGPAMVEFKRRASDGRLFLMELNPKLWGSLDLTIAAGVHIPSDLVEVASGRHLKENLSYERGVLFWWPLDSWESFFGRSRIKGHRRPVTNIHLRDPWPFVAGILLLLRKTLLKISKTVGVNRVMSWWFGDGPSIAVSRLIDETLGLPLRRNCQIDDFLWVGAKPRFFGSVYVKMVLRRTPVSLLRGDLADVSLKQSKTRVVPITEFVGIPQADFLAAIRQLETLRQNGEKAFVHCREGVGRAPSVAVAYLIYKGFSLPEAVHKVTTGRKLTKINSLQMASLSQFERSLHSANHG